MEHVDVVIVGSGPAGMSTALHLVQAEPTWADRLVVIDKAIHPREKLCGGGITRFGENILLKLGLPFEPPHVAIREVRLIYQDQVFAFYGDPVFRVVRRDEFDHWLVQQGEARGVTVRQGEALTGIDLQDDGVKVVTERGAFYTQAIVAADGSRSFIRRQLKWGHDKDVARLLEVLTPEPVEEQEAFREGVAVFDFSRMPAGLQGYYWDFPSLINNRPFMNRGVFDSRISSKRTRVALREELREALSKRSRHLADYTLKGHPIHWFNRKARLSVPRVLLAGDAAGVDPLVGEGISFALGYGDVAAQTLIDAFGRQDFSFDDYYHRVLSHAIVGQLRMRANLARLIYRLRRPWLIRWGWRLTPLLIRFLVWRNPLYVPLDPPRLVKVS